MSRFSGGQRRGATAEQRTARYRAAVGRQLLYLEARGAEYAPIGLFVRPGNSGDPEVDSVDYVSYVPGHQPDPPEESSE